MKCMLAWIFSATAVSAVAADFQLTPVQLPSGLTMTGTVTTDGTVGPLTPAQIVGWRITLRRTTRYDYTPANAPPQNVLGVAVTADGRKLRVAARADGAGGALSFGTVAPEVSVHLANYAAGWPAGMGFALYQYGADFEYLDLPVEAQGWRVVARAAPGSAQFKVLPITFASGATVAGTITTDGSTGAIGAAQLVGWHLTMRRHEDIVYYRDATGANSVVLPASTGLSTDGSQLWVARPGGYLGFGVVAAPPARGRGAVPADFSAGAPPRGQAGYYDPFGLEYTSLRFTGSLYPVARVQP